MTCKTQARIAIDTIHQYGGIPIPEIPAEGLCSEDYRIVRDFLTADSGCPDWETFVQEQKMGDCEYIAKTVERCFGLKYGFGSLDLDNEVYFDPTLEDDYNPYAEEDWEYDGESEEYVEDARLYEPSREIWHYWNVAPDGRILDFAKGTVKGLIENLDLSHPYPDTETRYHPDHI